MEGATRRYRAAPDYSRLAREFPRDGIAPYLKELRTPAYGSNRYRYVWEFAKSSGEIRCRLFAICADNQPRKLLRGAEGGRSEEATESIAKWATGPFRSPRCALQIRQRAE